MQTEAKVRAIAIHPTKYMLQGQLFTTGRNRVFQEVRAQAQYFFRGVILGVCIARIMTLPTKALEKR